MSIDGQNQISVDGEILVTATGVAPDVVGSAEIIDGEVKGVDIFNGAITDIKIAGPISISKLDTDPLARANHTGTQLASTISDFSSAVDGESVGGDVTGTVSNISVTDDSHSHTLSTITDSGTAAASAATDFVAVVGDTMTGALNIDTIGINIPGLFVRSTGGGGEETKLTPTSLRFGTGGPADWIMGRSAAGIAKMGVGSKLQQVDAPTVDDDLANKKYVDDEIVSHTGSLTAADIANVPAGSVAATDVQAAVDELASEKIDKAGGTFTGAVSVAGAGVALAFTLGASSDEAITAKALGDLWDRYTMLKTGEMQWDTDQDGVNEIELTPTGDDLVLSAGSQIQVPQNPAVDNDLARKKYVDDEIAANAVVSYRDITTGETTNSSDTVFVEGATWTTPSLAAGDYWLAVTAEFEQTSNGRISDAYIELDNTTKVIDKWREWLDEQDSAQTTTVQRQVTLGAGTSQFDLDFKTLNGGGTVKVRNIEFMLRSA